MEKYYNCKQIADRYGVKNSTVWAWIREKKIPAVRIGKCYRVKESDLADLERANKVR